MLLQGDPSFHDWAFFLGLAVASDLEVLLAPFLYNSLEFVGNEDLVLHKGVYLLSLLWLLMQMFGRMVTPLVASPSKSSFRTWVAHFPRCPS